MAEYIKLDALMEYCQNQKDKTISCNDLARFNIADVIERSKVDKAIKEIEALKKYEMERFSEDVMYHKALKKCLEILKRI